MINNFAKCLIVTLTTLSLSLGNVAGQEKVDLNTATASQLQELPGIGPALAIRIVEFRQENGPFKRIEDLMNVRGIGEKNFEKIRSRITVGPASEGGRQKSPSGAGKAPPVPSRIA